MSYGEFPMPAGDEYHNWKNERDGRPTPVQPRSTILPPLFARTSNNEQPPAYNETDQNPYNSMPHPSFNSQPTSSHHNHLNAFVAHYQPEMSQIRRDPITSTSATSPLRLSNTAQNLVIFF